MHNSLRAHVGVRRKMKKQKIDPAIEEMLNGKSSTSSALTSLIGRVKIGEGKNLTSGVIAKAGTSEERKLTNTMELDERRARYVERTKVARIGRASAKTQNHGVYPYPAWMEKHGPKKICLEVYFETDTSHLIDSYTARVHLMLTPRWQDPDTIRLDVKDFDPEAYTAIVQCLSQSVYTSTTWSRLPERSSWYIVYGFSESVNDVRMEVAEALELEGKPITVAIKAIRYKLKDDTQWTWPKVRDLENNTFRIKSSTELHRGLTRSYRVLDRALYRLRKPPSVLLRVKK